MKVLKNQEMNQVKGGLMLFSATAGNGGAFSSRACLAPVADYRNDEAVRATIKF